MLRYHLQEDEFIKARDKLLANIENIGRRIRPPFKRMPRVDDDGSAEIADSPVFGLKERPMGVAE